MAFIFFIKTFKYYGGRRKKFNEEVKIRHTLLFLLVS